MKRFLIIALALVLSLGICFGMVGCKKNNPNSSDSGGGDTPKISITLSETTHNAVEDDIFTLTATVTPSNTVRWSSDNEKVASVSSIGKVIAKTAGQATIIAEAEGVTASCRVIVSEAEKSDYYIVTDKTTYLTALNNSENEKIIAKMYLADKNGDTEVNNETFSFSVLDEKIATVSGNGEITPVGVGTTEAVISARGISTYVTIDVYTAAISTPADWLAMFKDDVKLNDRYYLKNDIDFSGVSYDLGRDFPVFSAEVNGNYHSVKNITEWREKRYADSSRDAFQGIFGADVFGARVKNISFKNIRFTKSDCAVLADSVRMHPDNYHWGDPQYETKFSNIIIEAIYSVDGSGLFKTVYGCNMENVFAQLRKADGSTFGTDFNCVVKEDYLNWGLGTSIFEKVVVYVEGGTNWERNPSSLGITIKDSYISPTKQDALYRAFTTFDKNVWKLTEKELPEFRDKI